MMYCRNDSPSSPTVLLSQGMNRYLLSARRVRNFNSARYSDVSFLDDLSAPSSFSHATSSGDGFSDCSIFLNPDQEAGRNGLNGPASGPAALFLSLDRTQKLCLRSWVFMNSFRAPFVCSGASFLLFFLFGESF